MPRRLTYILPIRSTSPVRHELLTYLSFLLHLDAVAEVIVVDGSEDPFFADFSQRCDGRLRHVAVDSRFSRLTNGKVAGVLTGLRIASQPCVVIADEDIRYRADDLNAMRRALDSADVVRPQNYFDPLPWHALLDTARTLINRATGGDWPGTLGVRQALLDRTGGYDGNVLFENLELVRTVRSAGGHEVCPLDLFVRRLPPRTAHFWSQRVRQAYDEFARPARMCIWLAALPAAAVLVWRFHWLGAATAIAIPIVVAEIGRRRGQGVRVFPFAATAAAPLWVLERSVCSWLAIASRLCLGGIPYHGRILRRSATPSRTLSRKHSDAGRRQVRPTWRSRA